MSQIFGRGTKQPCQHTISISNKIPTNANEMFDLKEHLHRSSTFKNTFQVDLPKSQGSLLNNLAHTKCPFSSHQVVTHKRYWLCHGDAISITKGDGECKILG